MRFVEIAALGLLVGCGADERGSKRYVPVAISDGFVTSDVGGDRAAEASADVSMDASMDASVDAEVPDAPPVDLDGLSGDLQPEGDASWDGCPTQAWEPPNGWAAPIEASPDTWTWIEVEGTHCGDGSETGFAINPHEGAKTLFLYLEGGGGCWDYLTCEGLIQTSFHLDGYDESTFNGLIAEAYKDMWFFDRDSDTNPLADAHHVFIPYCTGDGHAGDAVRELQGLLPWNSGTFHFKGKSNLVADLAHIVPSFPEVERVVLSGASAGGFGAGLNWPLVGQAFGPGVRVDLIDDSGPPIEPNAGIWPTWIETWNVVLPEACTGCDGNIAAVVDYFREEMLHQGQLALLSYTRDAIISTFFQLSPFVFEERLYGLLEVLDQEPAAHYFAIDGAGHTLTILGTQGIESTGGVKLTDWLIDFLGDAPELQSLSP